MYEPTTGRWSTVDPKGFAAGDADLFRFVGNDPTNFIDPSGLVAKIANQPPMPIFDHTVMNYNDKLADRVFKLTNANGAPQFTVSASLEALRQDDTKDQKDHPTNYLNLTVTTGDDALSRAALLSTYWLQIGRADRYKDADDEKAGTDSNGKGTFPVQRFPTDDPTKFANAQLAFGKTFLDGGAGNSPYMTDTATGAYRRTKTSLTFWDAPSFARHVDKDYPIAVQTFSAFLVISGEVVYEVDWKVRTDWNGGMPTTEVLGVVGSIPKSVPAFLTAKKLYRGTGPGVMDLSNPVMKLSPDLTPVKP